MFGVPNQPTLADMANQYQFNQQLNVYQQIQKNKSMEEFNQIISSLSQSEQSELMSSQSFIEAKSYYEECFIEYLASKFGNEFLSSQLGDKAATELLSATKSGLDSIQYKAKQRDEKLQKLAELLERNPELAKQLEE